MSKKPEDKLSGRAVADEKGNQKWVWKSDKSIDTAVVRALGEGLTLEGPASANPESGSNPYDRTQPGRRPQVAPADKEPAKRRTLDDMRKLSEAIKRAKQKTRS